MTSRPFQTGAAGSSMALRHSPWWPAGTCPQEGAYVAVLSSFKLFGRPSNLTVHLAGEPDLVTPPRDACPTTVVLV